MILDEKLPRYLLGKYQLIGTVTFSVLFAVVFLNIYIPFSDTAWFGLGDSEMFRHTVVFIAVSILILICSRMLMYRSKSMYDIHRLHHMVHNGDRDNLRILHLVHYRHNHPWRRR